MMNLMSKLSMLDRIRKNSQFISVFALSLLALQGCETTNTGKGFVQGKHGSVLDTVSFYVVNSYGSNSSLVEARFASGDVYTGKFIAATSDSKASDNLFEITIGDNDNDVTNNAPSTTYLSNAEGVLFTQSGKSMQCTMTLATPSSGFEGGAVGKCKTSSGDFIPMQLSEAD